MIIENYGGQRKLKNSYFEFIEGIFPGADFREWDSRGYWDERYIPHSIYLDGRIVSNVSATKMRLMINGRETKGIQIGAVGTLSAYREKGYSRILMEYVLNKYRQSTDIFFLFANESVLDFYPKFGFKRFNEKIFFKRISRSDTKSTVRKLDLNSSADFSIINRLINTRRPVTECFGALDYGFVTAWHLFNAFKNDIYYLDEGDVILVARQTEDALHLWDVVFSGELDFHETVKRITNKNVSRIIFYFPPDILNYEYDAVIDSDESPLFIKGDFQSANIDFKFPVTAQT